MDSLVEAMENEVLRGMLLGVLAAVYAVGAYYLGQGLRFLPADLRPQIPRLMAGTGLLLAIPLHAWVESHVYGVNLAEFVAALGIGGYGAGHIHDKKKNGGKKPWQD